jgi:hypothetical protein
LFLENWIKEYYVILATVELFEDVKSTEKVDGFYIFDRTLALNAWGKRVGHIRI